MSNILDNLLYTKDDEWILVEGDIGTVGITDHAQDSLSDIVYIELPDEGSSFNHGDSFGVVESVKAAADLYMPVSGVIVAANEELPDQPEVINSDPYGAGWMIKVELKDKSELDDLMDAAAYKQYCADRE
jgi:glycine cleavage system H protein